MVNLSRAQAQHDAPDGDRNADQHRDHLIDTAVQRLKEMVGPELELDVLGQPVVDHQRAEQRRLRLYIMRKRGNVACLRVYKSERFDHRAIIGRSGPGHKL